LHTLELPQEAECNSYSTSSLKHCQGLLDDGAGARDQGGGAAGDGGL